MPAKYLNILALSAVVFLACPFSPTPVSALSIDSNGLQARHAHIGHAFAKRAPKRCKVRSPAADGSLPSSSSSTPSPAPTPAPASTPTPPSTSGGGKGGLSYVGSSQAILSNFKTGHVSAAYNWSPYKIPGADALGYEFVPMLWGTKDIEQWTQLVKPGYARYALGFNEPDHNQQSYMDPGTAAALWNQHMRPLRNSGYILISPATTSSPDSIAWMQNFLAACGDNCVDKIAVHWYGIKADEFISYLQKWYTAFQKPIWVTEVACMDFVTFTTCPDVMGFARTIRGFMDSTPWVERYFPFTIADNLGNVDPVNKLLAGERPTDLGWVYFG